ncbi:MAG: MlaE family ABC transporter permease [Gammaproteobacteria bacterium]
MPESSLSATIHANGSREIILGGSWTLKVLCDRKRLESLEKQIGLLASQHREASWNLEGASLDHFGALVLRRIWGQAPPATLIRTPAQASLFERWEHTPPCPVESTEDSIGFWLKPARWVFETLTETVETIGLVILLFAKFLRQFLESLVRPQKVPWAEISREIYEIGVKGLGIVALVGTLIGIVIGYLAGLQLQGFALRSFLVFIIGVSVLRELGPMLAAILVAGRSGSAITAELGVMKIRGEIDALRAMGVDPAYRLLFPRLVALMIVMPLLVGWSDCFGLASGIGAAALTLHTSFFPLLYALPHIVPIVNLWLGVLKGLCFGLIIGLVATHLGWEVRADAGSLGQETTRSVVLAITLVIALDALAAVLFQHIGF